MQTKQNKTKPNHKERKIRSIKGATAAALVAKGRKTLCLDAGFEGVHWSLRKPAEVVF